MTVLTIFIYINDLLLLLLWRPSKVVKSAKDNHLAFFGVVRGGIPEVSSVTYSSMVRGRWPGRHNNGKS
jgi:hypothetical protein